METVETVSKYLLNSPCYILVLVAVVIGTSFIIVKFKKKELIVENHNVSIDALRGFLAFGVFVHHVYVNYQYTITKQWNHPDSNILNQMGSASVVLFFMITAFLFIGKIINPKRKLSWRILYINRFFRLTPLYLFVISMLVVCCFSFAHFTLNVPSHELFASINKWILFTIPGSPDINNIAETNIIVARVIWTLAYEWLFYVSLPLIALILVKKRSIKLLCLSLCSLVLTFIVSREISNLQYSVVITFSGGICAAYWVLDEKRSSFLKSSYFSFLAIISLFICVLFFHHSFSPVPLILLTFFFVVIASGNNVFGLLNRKPIIWLGQISYSIYLIHGIIITIILRKCTSGHSPVRYLLHSMLATIILICISSLTYVLIEKPGMHVGKRLIDSMEKR